MYKLSGKFTKKSWIYNLQIYKKKTLIFSEIKVENLQENQTCKFTRKCGYSNIEVVNLQEKKLANLPN